MPRQESVKVPIDDIRRTLEDLDRQRTQNRARGRQGASQSTVPNSLTSQRAVHRRQEPVRVPPDDATLQALLEPQKEPVRVPHEEILRMLDHLDRQRAEDRARQRAGKTEQIERPTTPNRLYRPPQTLPSSKRHREQEALPAPSPTQLHRSPKRRRRSMEETPPTPPNTQPSPCPETKPLPEEEAAVDGGNASNSAEHATKPRPDEAAAHAGNRPTPAGVNQFYSTIP
ncbi:hypothetical protein BKA56DRAFT_623980 [Ilyonectria sp. MPI-CAGE-AT-0026]|nr:hypothetical protein BKA56DRAFT_623980 [Ilyonectria sp. MPI-CAGE-AT-0026]